MRASKENVEGCRGGRWTLAALLHHPGLGWGSPDLPELPCSPVGLTLCSQRAVEGENLE